jgi:transcriptional regulator
MYVKSQFRETRTEVLHGLARAHPLATFITSVNGEIVVNHMPFVVSTRGGEYGTLKGHLPRENPVWRALDGSLEAVAVFQGPEAYISPSWCPSKQAHGKVVPTWNYAVVHARGRPRVIEDSDWLCAHLNELTDEHESAQVAPWKVSDAPEDFIARMIDHLVGVEMPISSLLGKWKVSQNRPAEDRRGVSAGLRARSDDRSLAMERLVMDRLDPTD